ncbi:MAG: SET domain-containing protein [Thioploca sp.]|nr:SET domain-containing protein [Thioploca sp.]
MTAIYYAKLFKKIAENYILGKSKIDGTGIFADKDLGMYDEIGMALELRKADKNSIYYERTRLGLMLNHSDTPNAYLEKIGNDYYLVARLAIQSGDEITVDYDRYKKQLKNEEDKTKRSVIVR